MKGENPCLKDPLLPSRVQSTRLCASCTRHVGTVGWEPQCSSPTTCAGKADHGLVYVCDIRRTLVKLVNRSPSARDPAWVITPVNPLKVWSIA